MTCIEGCLFIIILIFAFYFTSVDVSIYFFYTAYVQIENSFVLFLILSSDYLLFLNFQYLEKKVPCTCNSDGIGRIYKTNFFFIPPTSWAVGLHLDLPLSIYPKIYDKGGKVGASVSCGHHF